MHLTVPKCMQSTSQYTACRNCLFSFPIGWVAPDYLRDVTLWIEEIAGCAIDTMACKVGLQDYCYQTVQFCPAQCVKHTEYWAIIQENVSWDSRLSVFKQTLCIFCYFDLLVLAKFLPCVRGCFLWIFPYFWNLLHRIYY